MARIDSKYDATANDSDKSWTVPDGEVWEILYIHGILDSTATVGNREFRIDIADADSQVILSIHPGAVQTAGNTYHYLGMQGVYRETSFVLDEMHIPIADDLFLAPGWSIRIFDVNAVDAAADDLTAAFIYKAYSLGEI